MKNKKILLLIVAFLLIASYITIFSSYYIEKINAPKGNNNRNDVEEIITIDKVLNFIKNYKLDNLDILKITYTNASDVKNNEKLKLAYYSNYKELDYKIGVSYTKLNSYIYSVFGDNTSIVNEDIIFNKDDIVKYDLSNEVYISNIDNSTLNESNVLYRHIVEFKSNNGKHVLKLNKFYENNNNVYASYNDYLENKNILFIVPTDQEKSVYIKEYVEENYNQIKEKIHLYTYVFSKDKTSLILKSYEIDK